MSNIHSSVENVTFSHPSDAIASPGHNMNPVSSIGHHGTTPTLTNSTSTMTIMPLGAGNEVGRSSILLSYKGKNILLDCGVHPAYSGISSLPFFDAIDPNSIDVILITHFHLDHIASLPYFMEKTAFKGRVYMTHPTKAIYKWLLLDFVKVSVNAPTDALFDENDLHHSFEKIIAIDYHQEIDVGDGLRFTAYHAGHVLGAAMFMVEIAGIRVLYTGDYSREADRHLWAAEKPQGPPPHVMICEATYGVQSHEPRMERERRFTSRVHEVVARGGRCLLPVFALGKAHELLMILDEYWREHPELKDVPIYYASSLTKKCLSVYQTYLNMMSPNTFASGSVQNGNPSTFQYVTSVKGNNISSSEMHGNTTSFGLETNTGPCVVMASPGMLQSGLSRELLEAWCDDSKNGVILTGYSVEGTLAKGLLSEPTEITSVSHHHHHHHQSKRSIIPFKMSVESISFSAHVDFVENARFIEELQPINLVLVHGEYNEMMRLRNALQHKYDMVAEEGCPQTKIYTPRNCERLDLVFGESRIAKVVGSLVAEKSIIDNDELDALVAIGKSFEMNILSPKDLNDYYPILRPGAHSGGVRIKSTAPFSLVCYQIEQLVGKGNVSIQNPHSISLFNEEISVFEEIEGSSLLVMWRAATPLTEMMADSIAALVIGIDSSPSSVTLTNTTHTHPDKESVCTHLANESKLSINISDENETSDMHIDEKKPDELLLGSLLRNYYEHVQEKPNACYEIDAGDKSLYYLSLSPQLKVEGPDPRTVAHINKIAALHALVGSISMTEPDFAL